MLFLIIELQALIQNKFFFWKYNLIHLNLHIYHLLIDKYLYFISYLILLIPIY